MSNDTETQQDQADNPVIKLLEDTRALLEGSRAKPGALARDADGHPIDANSDKAQTYSLAGALQRAIYNRHGDSTGIDTVHVLLGLGNLTDASIAGLNGLSDKELGQRFDKALAQARGETYDEPEDGEDDQEAEDDVAESEDAQDAALRGNGTVDDPNNPQGNKLER